MAINTFIQELKKRNVFKVASIYVVTAWLIIQVVATTFPMFEFPVWSQRMIVILLVLGFPLALILAWAQESKVEEEEEETGKKNRWILPVAVLGVGILGILVWRLGKSLGSNQLLPAEIREEKVGVSIFENRTQDESLDALGYLASEWITSGLREIKVESVSPEMMREFNDYITVFPNNPQGKPAFVDLTGAQYLINGTYFDHGRDSLRMNIRLLNTSSGEMIKEFPSLFFPKSAQEDIVEEARQYLMGYWAAKKNQHFPKVDPPRFEAYEIFSKCQNYLPCNLRALAKDSTFLLNRVHVMWLSIWADNDSMHQANKLYLQQHWDDLTNYEQLFFHAAERFRQGDYEGAFAGLVEMHQMDPLDFNTLNNLGSFGVYFIQNPGTVLAASEPIFDKYEAYQGKIWDNMVGHFIVALFQLGQYEKIISYCEGPLGRNLEFRSEAERITGFMFFLAYLKVGQADQAIQLVNLMLQKNDNIRTLTGAAYHWAAFYGASKPNPFMKDLLARQDEIPDIQEIGDWPLIRALFEGPIYLKEYIPYLQGDWLEAEQNFLELKRLDSSHFEMESAFNTHWTRGLSDLLIEATLGSIYARQGKETLANEQFEKLEGFREDFSKRLNPFAKGLISYNQAKIKAILNQKESAVALLNQARKEGLTTQRFKLISNLDFFNLRGYAPFEALLEPKKEMTDLVSKSN